MVVLPTKAGAVVVTSVDWLEPRRIVAGALFAVLMVAAWTRPDCEHRASAGTDPGLSAAESQPTAAEPASTASEPQPAATTPNAASDFNQPVMSDTSDATVSPLAEPESALGAVPGSNPAAGFGLGTFPMQAIDPELESEESLDPSPVPQVPSMTPANDRGWTALRREQQSIATELTIEVLSSTPQLRKDRANWITWTLTKSVPQLLEGELVVEVYPFAGQPVGTLVSETIVLSQAETIYRMLIPPAMCSRIETELGFEVWFRGKRATYYLGQKGWLAVSALTGRSCTLALVQEDGPDAIDPQRTSTVEALRLETLLDPNPATFEIRRVVTQVAPIDSREAPSEPLNWLAVDLVYLGPRGLTGLRTEQRQALSAWIRGGGAVWIDARGRIPPQHVEWLNRLISQHPAEPVLALNERGELTERGRVDSGSAAAGLIATSFDWGRVVVQYQPMAEDSPRRSQLSRYLWRIRTDWDAEQSNRSFNLTDLVSTPRGAISAADYDQMRIAASKYGPQASPVATGLAGALLPENVRTLPPWLVGSVLGVLLVWLTIGEYFVLGWFRLRKLTWITAPVACVLTAAGLASLSASYLRSSVVERAVEIVDLGRDGRVVRETRFVLRLPQTTEQLTTDHRSAIVDLVDSRPAGANRGMAAIDPNQQLHLTGRFPQSYRAGQTLEQWVPRFSRWTSISRETDPRPPRAGTDESNRDSVTQVRSASDDAVRAALADVAAILVSQNQGSPESQADVIPPSVRDQIEQRFSDPAVARPGRGWFCSHLGRHAWVGERVLTRFLRWNDLSGLESATSINGVLATVDGQVVNQIGGAGFLSERVLPSLVQGTREPALQVLAGTSPQGNRYWEDLATVDPSDSRMAMVMLVETEGDRLRITRYLHDGSRPELLTGPSWRGPDKAMLLAAQ